MFKYFLSKETENGVRFLLRETETIGLVPVFCNRQNGAFCGNHCEAFSFSPSGGVFCSLTRGEFFHIIEPETPEMPKPKPKPDVSSKRLEVVK